MLDSDHPVWASDECQRPKVKENHTMWRGCRGCLVPGHCLIIPMEHVASCRMADEAVWTEMRNFKKCLVQMYAEQARLGGTRARTPLALLNSGC